MKRSVVAVVLNCLCPGVGLWYLGKPWWGLMNLLVVIAVGVVLLFVLPNACTTDYFHYFLLCYVTGSGGLAHNIASRSTEQKNLSQESS